MAAEPGVISNIHFHPAIESKIIDRLMLQKPDDKVEDHLVAKLGIVFLEFESHDELVSQSQKMQELIRADIVEAAQGT